MQNWFSKTTDIVFQELGVNPDKGLSEDDVAKARKRVGLNELQIIKPPSALKILIRQFKDVLIIILILSALVSLGLHYINGEESVQESLLILAIVVLIVAIGFFNEFRAEKTVEALRKLVSHKTSVRRNGKVIEVASNELVPGDIILLGEGQKVPADIRLYNVKALRINEASLTGESLPVSKNALTLKTAASLGDQKNMAFAGTLIVSGTGEGVVVATGRDTELGKIADLINHVPEEMTPMQKKLDALGKRLGVMIGVICVITFVIIFFFVQDETTKTTVSRIIFALTATVALAVAAIPEGLAFVVRISLAMGARRMAAKNALVRRLSAVEALGSTDVICTDKTGTLTKGEMTVRELYVYEHDYTWPGEKAMDHGKAINNLLTTGVLCNNAHINNGKIIGDQTEGSLLIAAEKALMDLKSITSNHSRLDEVPFSSDRKMMTTLHLDGSSYLIVQKGALEVVLGNCTHYQNSEGKELKLTSKEREVILAKNKELAGKALRVLAFASKKVNSKPNNLSEHESGLVFLGLQAMIDPPREEVVNVIHRVQAESGIRVLMITGDYVETASAIAEEIGIRGRALSGVELDALSQPEFEKIVEEVSVYARVNPEHKIRIVQALKKHGHQVAMTGDGVNDAAALKAADIGIAMGITGTDATKEAADLILLDDKFVTIVSAIEEGRAIFDNTRKFVNFLLSTNVAEVLSILLGIVLFQNLILTAAQILFTNILTDGLPAIALSSDPVQKGTLKFKPQRFQEEIINKRIWVEMVIFSVLMSVLVLALYNYVYDERGVIAAMSAVFVGMVIFEKARLYEIRSDYQIKWYQNPWLTITVVLTIFTQVALMYVPWFAEFMKVTPPNAAEWLLMISGAVFIYLAMRALRPLIIRFT